MKQQLLYPEGAPPPTAPYTPGIRVGETLYTAGQAPFDDNNQIVGSDVAAQTEQVFNNLERRFTRNIRLSSTFFTSII